MNMALMVSVVAFLAVVIVFVAVWLFFGTNTKEEVVLKRFEAVRKAERRGAVSLDLKLIRDEMYSSVPLLHRLMLQVAWASRLQEYINQAGMKIRPGKVILMSAVSGFAGAVIIEQFYHSGLLALIIGGLAAIAPLAFISYKRMRRLRKFEEGFPETLDLLGRAVRAGHAFTTGLEMVSKESPEPVAGEFRTTFEEQNFGLPLRDALTNMAERVPSVDVRFFVTALLVQKETGGNLAEILDELSRVIRERFRIYREVNVKTAQGRLTALILISLPIGMLIFLQMINPVYMHVLYDDPLGPTILSVAAFMQIIGGIVLWKIVRIEV
jgi:tight adherence protein B